jgi:hypothetical protein
MYARKDELINVANDLFLRKPRNRVYIFFRVAVRSNQVSDCKDDQIRTSLFLFSDYAIVPPFYA